MFNPAKTGDGDGNGGDLRSGGKIRALALALAALAFTAAAPAEGPKLRPGELPVDPTVLEPVNVLISWAGYRDGEETEGTPVLIEYEEFIHGWRPAGQIRWVSIGGESPAYDLMIVDLETLRIKVRHEPLAGGGLSVRNWFPGRATGGALAVDGTVTTWSHGQEDPIFDIATLPFVFASIRWDEVDAHFQLPVGDYEDGVVNSGDAFWYQIEDAGLTRYEDVHGKEREVRRVSIVNYGEGEDRRVDYYVSPGPPYWVGLIARSPEGEPTSIVRVDEFEMRGVTLGKHIQRFMEKRPDE